MYSDFNSMIYGEDGENPIRPTIIRCINQAKEDGQRLRVEIRTKALGTTTTRQEHVFAVDAVEAHVDTIMSSICERLNSSPGEGFEGECRVNFYQSGNTTVKYGSYTRKIKNYESNFEEPQRQNFINPGMMGGMNQNQNPNPYGGFQNEEDPFGNLENGEEDYGEQEDQDSTPQQPNQMNQMNHMMQMMMQMQQQQSGGAQANPYNIVDQKMAMDWLNHCMSFLFRSLTQQMAMFERSTKMIEIYSMRFGLPQPLERPSPERIIREVPMDFPQQGAPAPPEPSGLGILPALLQAAASLANSPGAANMLKTAGSLAAGVGQKPTQAPPPPQQIAPQSPSRPRTRVEKMGKPAKYKKNTPKQHAEPINDVDEFGWDGEGETPPMRMGPQSDEGYMFGLDGNSRTPINPFESEPPFANDLGDELEENIEMGDDDALGLNLQLDDIDLPEDFPDLNGMTADEMKETVINWINADPDNRKGQILEMLPELSSLIV